MIIKKICLILATVLLFACPAKAESEEELLLASATEAVAGAESYTVMLSVASVLLNRLESDAYPVSLAAVISDAGIDISSAVPSERALQAARDAIGGFDPTGGALRYSRDAKDLPKVLLGTDSWCFY
jgi:spore germination cell wall hydrolase CwlJ-like protein